MTQKILRHQELIVYKKAIQATMQIFELTKILQRRDLLINRSSSTILAIGSAKYR